MVPVITLRKMSQGTAKLKRLLIFPISVAVACACYRLAPSEFWANRLGLGFQPPAPGLIVALAIIGLPYPAIIIELVIALRRRGWRSLPGSVGALRGRMRRRGRLVDLLPPSQLDGSR